MNNSNYSIIRTLHIVIATIIAVMMMLLPSTTLAFTVATKTATQSCRSISYFTTASLPTPNVVLFGYLDNISRQELYDPIGSNDDVDQSREATQMNKADIDRYGPGDLSQYVDFGDEFDGGDGRT
jgi:hypothetical protein